MIPVWSDNYSIGNVRVDNQHKKLFELATKAYTMENKYISKDEMKRVLAEFFDYMKYHFDDEEIFMKSINYPRLEEHAKIHKSIIESMIKLITEIHNVNEMKEQLVIIAKKWLLEHILQEDMKIGAFIKSNAFDSQKIQQISPNFNEISPQKQEFLYKCACDGKIHTLSQEIHQKIINGAKFKCKKCGEILVFCKD